MTTQQSNMSLLLQKYDSLSKDITSNFNNNNILRVLHVVSTEAKVNPYDPRIWNNWENLQKEKPDSMSSLEVEMPKFIVKDGKRVRDGDKIEKKCRRLKRPTTFNASGKNAVTFIIINLVDEAVQSLSTINEKRISDPTGIKQVIINHCTNKNGAVSHLVYGICDKIPDVQVLDIYQDNKGHSFELTLENKIVEYITNSDVRNTVTKSITKFLRIFDGFVATGLWASSKHDTKKDGDEITGGSGKSTGVQQMMHFLIFANTILLSRTERSDGSIYTNLLEFVNDYQKNQTEKKQKEPSEKKKKRGVKPQADEPVTDNAISNPPPTQQPETNVANGDIVVNTPAPRTRRGR